MKKLKYPNLFSPLRINGVMLKNRVIAAPMGVPRAKLVSSTYYGGISLLDKANGGSSAVAFSSYGVADIAQEKNAFDKYACDVTRETLSVLEASGAIGVIEFMFHPKKNEDGSLQAPSDGIAFTKIDKAKAMTKEQMKQQIEELCLDCKKAKEFGFRMIMLHFGHDSQCSIFLSSVWNQRKDEYGGSLENRTRFAYEALKAVRETVGKDFPIMVRISRNLMVPETYTEDDMFYFVDRVKEFVDIFNVSCGMDCYGGTVDNYEANIYTHTTIFEPRYYNLDFATRLKKELGVKVCLVGGVSDPQVCEEMIKNHQIDAVMLGRQLVADPYWTFKAKEGKDLDIVPCLRCLNCYHIATEHRNTQCSVNPRFRRENRVPLVETKVDTPKRVVVVGGGPAGMQAACYADKKGHSVILIEKEDRLGGQLNIASLGAYKKDIAKLKEYLIHQIETSNVQVMLNTKATYELLQELYPDDVILAIGADFMLPNIPGIHHAKLAHEAYMDGLDTIDGVSLIIGGGTIGSELALELAEMGKEVIIVEKGNQLAKTGNKLYQIGLRHHLNKVKSLKVYFESEVKEIVDYEVTVLHQNKEFKIHVDHIFTAIGLESRKEEAFSLYGIAPETMMIGDCKQVASIIEAMNDGYFAGVNVK